MAEYCKGCGIKLPDNLGVLQGMSGFLLGGQQKVYEFDDGKYCEKCAKMRVDKRRKEA